NLLKDGNRCSTGNRVTAERTTDASGRGNVHDFCASRHTRERKPTRDSLRGEDHVWFEPEVLAREHVSGAGDPRLDVVGDKDDSVLAAPCGKRWEVAVSRDDETALALDRFDDEAREVICSSGFFEPLDGAFRCLFTGEPVV